MPHICNHEHETGERCELRANHAGWHQETSAHEIFRWSSARGSWATYPRTPRKLSDVPGVVEVSTEQREHLARVDAAEFTQSQRFGF